MKQPLFKTFIISLLVAPLFSCGGSGSEDAEMVQTPSTQQAPQTTENLSQAENTESFTLKLTDLKITRISNNESVPFELEEVSNTVQVK